MIAPPPERTSCAAQERGDVQVSEEVATVPSFDGVPFDVQYASPPMFGTEDVPTWAEMEEAVAPMR